MDSIYRGYRRIKATTDEINEFLAKPSFDDWYTNEYLIIDDLDTGKTIEMRFNGSKFVELKLPPSRFIKGKNSEQRCALDMLANKDITVCALLGTYGSGKSFLSMQMALYHVKEKGNQSHILGVREPKGEGQGLGYLPGDFHEKNGAWIPPLTQQLSGKEWELRQLRDEGVIDFNIPYYMKGTSYADTIMIIDEAEDLTRKQIKLIGTRVAENSRIFFDGDYRQSATPNQQSPLLMMCEALKGNPLFACITLEEDVRSVTSRIFSNLFEDD